MTLVMTLILKEGIRMEIENLYLHTRFLADHPKFINEIPSGYIIHKTLCGLGATHGEALFYERHSIILLPNTPVLVGKKTAKREDGSLKYPNICIVYEDIDVTEVIRYLNDDTVKDKKILCTPEAYKHKVRNALLEHPNFDLYNDFFMLIDECDSLVKTVFFRGKIVSPLIDFFKFKKKSMISATPLKPSDPRFEEHNFKVLKVNPQYEYKKKIDIIHTNNINASVECFIESNAGKKIFIFLNSTSLSAKLIKKLDIENDSMILCSEEKVRELKRKQGIKYASSKLDVLKKYNFLTSRFFSAVDIDNVEEKPEILMITDLYRAPFSLIDPYSDGIQIVGRLRNGVNSITHITNIKTDIEYKTPDEATQLINESYACYRDLVLVRNNTDTQYGKITAKEAIENTFIHKFIEEGTSIINYFACDCYRLSNLIRSYYKNVTELTEAYIRTNYFIPKVFNRLYDADDAIMELLENEQLGKAKLFECVATLLFFYNNRHTTDRIPCVSNQLQLKLRNDYPDVARIFDKLGYLKMKELEFSEAKLIEEYKSFIRNEKLNDEGLKREIKSLYNVGDTVIKAETIGAIKNIYTRHGLDIKVKGTTIENYYVVETTTIDTSEGKKHSWNIIAIKS